MAFYRRQIPRMIKSCLGWVLRPRLAYWRLREMRHARRARPVRDNLDTSSLPEVIVRQAVTAEELDQLIDLYRRNPSKLSIAPRVAKEMEAMLARGVEFFLLFDVHGNHIGNSGFQVSRSMVGYHLIDYRYRSSGYGMAARLAVENLLVQRGYDCLYSQVFRVNRRALSMARSVGYEIDEAQSTAKYYTLKKRFKT